MSVRSIITVVVLIAGPLLTVAEPAGAGTPRTCLPEVDGAGLDGTVDFAGRIRSFAGDDGTIASRSLTCPYRFEDGRASMLVLQWDEQALGRFRCEATGLAVVDGEPATGRLDHPDRQATVLLEAPDGASLRAMEAAARVTLGLVPDAAAPCAAGTAAAGEAADGPGATTSIGLAIAALVAIGAVVALLRRRHVRRGRARAQPAEIEHPLGSVAPSMGEAPPRAASVALADHPLDGAERARLDALAAAAIIAREQGRADLVRLAVAARRSARSERVLDRCLPADRLAVRILESAAQPADGSTMTPLEARRYLLDDRRAPEHRPVDQADRANERVGA